MSLLEVRNLSKYYDQRGQRVVALDGVSFRVVEDECIAVVGRSGGGKSTLLQIIAGLIESSSGEVRFNGQGVSEPCRSIALMFQQSSLLPWLSVLDNIAYPLRLAGSPVAERRERAMQLLLALKLEKLAERFPSQISGGQAQRVALARSIVMNPEVILFDEPFASVDAISREGLYATLEEAKKISRSSRILVTHDLSECLILSDRVLVLAEGRLVGELNISEYKKTAGEVRFEDSSAFLEARIQLKKMITSG